MSEKKVKEKKEKKKLNPMVLMMVLMLLLIVLLGAGLGYLILNQKKATTTTTVVVASNVLEVPPLTYPITKDFLVNLLDTDSKRYIKLNITLAFSSKKLTEELTTNDSFVKDTVISVLREKRAADFTAKGIDDLKKELKTRLNPYFKAGKISDVFINDILVQ